MILEKAPTNWNRLYYEKRHMKACPYCKGLRQKVVTRLFYNHKKSHSGLFLIRMAFIVSNCVRSVILCFYIFG